jgi:hypothetical protein|tara:strand:+ start:6116 stop:6799 length:684 start_codon:yes stop_codon:yes gene_type:complete
MKPNVIIVGPSGSGKSSSMRNLDPKSTAVINTERKQLPFKNANEFMNVPVKSVSEFHTALDKAMESDKVDTIVIESFTSLIEIIYREAEIRYKGFDIWGYYNKEIGRILDKSKNSDKYVVFTAIDGVYDGDNGVEERYVAIDGNRWKKRVEKEFVICLFTDTKATDEGVEYRFRTNTTGRDSAKSPMGMFLDLHIDNDLRKVISACKNYYSEPQTAIMNSTFAKEKV